MTQVQIQEVDDTEGQTEGDTAADEQYQELEELEQVDGENVIFNLHYITFIFIFCNF